MKKLLFGLGTIMLIAACNNNETKTGETVVKTADTASVVNAATTGSVPSTITTVVIAKTPQAMAAELCRLNKAIKTARSIGDQNMAAVSQKKYDEYNKTLREKFGNDYTAKKMIREIMEQCDKN